MPGRLIPRKSGVHRAACFALYRALLRQKHKLPWSGQQRQEYEKQIRIQTRINSRLQGHQDISSALRLGYATLETLQNDEGKRRALSTRIVELSTNRIVQSVDRTKGLLAKPAPASPMSDPAVPKPTGSGKVRWQAQSRPTPTSILNRPFLTISGRRHVPRLVNACKVPMLRIRKPQSPYISRIIRDTVRTRESRLSRSKELLKQTEIAEREDEWDLILSRQFGIKQPVDEQLWSEEPVRAHDDIKALHDRALKKRMKLAVEMTAIVEKEKALAEEEKMKRRDDRRKKRKLERLIRHGKVPEPATEVDI